MTSIKSRTKDERAGGRGPEVESESTLANFSTFAVANVAVVCIRA